MGKTILIVATLDTRGDEVEYLKRILEESGHQTLVLDAGVMGTPLFSGDFPREKVAEAGGKTLTELVEAAEKGADRFEATKIMMEGVRAITRELQSQGKVDGVIGLGGTTAAALGVAAMKELPIGMPKLLVTTFIDPGTIGDEDITVMQTPIDLVGMNKIIEKVLSNAAGAVTGMVERGLPPAIGARPLIGLTALGVTTPAVQKVISRLERAERDAVVFHAKTTMLDRLAQTAMVDGVIDITPFEVIPMALYPTEYVARLVGAPEVRRERLVNVLARGLPWVIAPGGLDMHIFPGTGIDSVPEEFRDRAWTMHGPGIVLVRTSSEELKKVATFIAEATRRASGPVAVVIPLRGFSEASREGAPLFDPQADRAFIETVKGSLGEEVEVVEVDCHINDEEFADAVMETFERILDRGR